MQILINIFLTIIVFFHLSLIISAIKRGKHLLGSTILPLRELPIVLKLLEQANVNASFSFKIDSLNSISCTF